MNKKNGLNLSVWKRLWPFIKALKKQLLIVTVFLVISSVSEAAYPLFTRYAVHNFIESGTTEGIGLFALAFALVIVVGGVAVVIYSKQSMVIEMRLGPALKRACFTHLQKLPIDYYSKSSVGYLLARVMSDTDRISSMISWGFTHLAWSVVYMIGTAAFMFALSPKLALIVIPVIPAAVVIIYLFERKIIAVNRRVRDINSRITGAYNEGITGAKTSKTLAVEERFSEDFRGLTRLMYRESMRASLLSAGLLPLVLFCGAVAVGAVLYRGGILVGQRLLDYGVLSAFISYAVGIIDPVQQAAHIITDAVAGQACIERVMALLDEPVTITDTPEVLEKYGDEVFPKRENWEPIDGDIEFRDVWFRYPGSEKYVLRGFNLTVPRGSTVAIVGETGAGKSTIVNLACRFYEPERGQVLVDGRDVRERSQLWLHSSLGYVLQDPHLFSGTIAENIRYGKTDATQAEVVAAAKMVSADVVAGRMAGGYGSEVGEGGDALSTGEKQLISFARAIISDPRIFVLDEATSSIDTETEALIQNAISNVLRERTSFIIAHRLSTIAKADMIIVIDDGEIVERGTHAELLALGGRYRALYEAMRLEEAAL
ncbi:MAG: ABC transporter ATP-binding protein/permease [Oscillospiraceae bacterium]|jgi:ATP-binding cassette subfamily B protein|nr:ABC transporter ATP-binding protein/permease [Oscillospiraceae bacterium]